MINSQNLIDKICAKIACGGLTALETCQTNGALNILSSPVCSVSTFSALPNGLTHTGRMIYVNDENRYYHAIGDRWLPNFDSTVCNYVDLIFTWGRANQGALGTNDTTPNRSSPVSIVGTFTDWCRVSAGSQMMLALRPNGTLWSWGFNSYGQLGDNTTVSKSSPVSVVGGFTDWTQISAGNGGSAAAVRANGTLWTWGGGSNGELGNNCNTSRSSPVSVVGGFTDWCQVSVGNGFSLAVRTNCTLWAWGYAGCGRLGNNTSSGNRSSPISVVGGFTDWCQASAGTQHGLAVRTNGTAWAWGRGYRGQLGNLCTSNFSSPISVVGGFTDWCQVAAGYEHSIALRTNGTLWSWGRGGFGVLGTGQQANHSSPVSVIGGFTDWCQISASNRQSLAVRTNGTAWSWGGNNTYGELGVGNVCFRTSPTILSGGFTDWCQVSAGQCIGAGVRQLQKGC